MCLIRAEGFQPRRSAGNFVAGGVVKGCEPRLRYRMRTSYLDACVEGVDSCRYIFGREVYTQRSSTIKSMQCDCGISAAASGCGVLYTSMSFIGGY